jgi:hypothetical protein
MKIKNSHLKGKIKNEVHKEQKDVNTIFKAKI